VLSAFSTSLRGHYIEHTPKHIELQTFSASTFQFEKEERLHRNVVQIMMFIALLRSTTWDNL
jgi:hypothetical protein